MPPALPSSGFDDGPPAPARCARGKGGFSLVEIVVAVGILALGLAAVLALFAPVSNAVRANQDSEVAARAAEAVVTYLKGLQWNQARTFIKTDAQFNTQLTNEGRGTYDPSRDSQALFVNRAGTVIGTYNETIWRGEHGEQYFEVAVVRNERISPASQDGSASTIAFMVRVRWPCFNPVSGGTGFTQFGKNQNPGRGQLAFDHSQKDVIFVNGSLTR